MRADERLRLEIPRLLGNDAVQYRIACLAPGLEAVLVFVRT